jgi:hypothetical protein
MGSNLRTKTIFLLVTVLYRIDLAGGACISPIRGINE